MVASVLGAAVTAPAQARQAAAAVRGVSVEITELPDKFVAGARPVTVTVVASKATGQECLKVRWSMVLQLDGLSLEQLQVDRVEENGSFPVDVVADGDTARVTDEQLDPGTLCRDSTVTARYQMNVANDVGKGQLTVLAEAYDANLQLLERDQATRSVVGDAEEQAGQPTESPEATAEPDEGAAADPGDADGSADAAGGAAGDAPAADAAEQAAAGNDQNGLPLAWFLIGGLMVFLGLSLLFNLKWRRRMEDRIGAPAMAGAGPAPGFDFDLDERLANDPSRGYDPGRGYERGYDPELDYDPDGPGEFELDPVPAPAARRRTVRSPGSSYRSRR